jgi:hypothetical protein
MTTGGIHLEARAIQQAIAINIEYWFEPKYLNESAPGRIHQDLEPQ